MKRRTFLELAATLPVAARGLAAPPWPGPVTRAALKVGEPPRSGEGPYSGDEFTLAHRYLRDGAAVPPAVDDPHVYDVLVVGGGPSGLISAWMLRDLDVLVLEKDRVYGGTAKSESWNGIPYSLGSAYFAVPDPGTPIDRFFRALGLDKHWRQFGDGDMGIFQGAKFELGFWDHPDRKAIAQAFTRMNEDRYPDLPFVAGEAWSRREFEEIDRLSWSQFLERGLPVKRRGKPVKLPRALAEFCQWFAPAVVSGLPGEVSAWVMLNQFLAEFGPLAALPGGNGFITRRIVEELAGTRARVQTGELAVSVETKGELVRVVTLGADGKATARTGRAAIFCGPKFVAAKVVLGLPVGQLEAIAQLKYRPFMVANVMLKKPVMDRNVYDAYCKGLPPESTLGDITFADYAARPTGSASVLTCYYPLPRDSARAELLDDSRLPVHRKQLVADLLSIMGPRGLTADDVADVRFTRWGHPMVVAKPGQLSGGVFDRAAAPCGRVAFAHMDNFGNPCIESSFEAARIATGKVRELAGSAGPTGITKKRRHR